MPKRTSPSGLRKKVTQDLIRRLREYEHGLRDKMTMLIVSGVALYLLFLFCAGDYGLVRISRLIQQRNQLNEDYQSIITEAADYKYRLRRLQSDPHFIEYIARTNYGYSRDGEFIYRLPSSNR